jgi:DNA invertase Pin-like site-specific DNA recombinase
VHDLASPGAPLTVRPGLAYALEQIAGGRVAGLVLARLGDLTRSPHELVLLLQRLDEARAFLVALDHQLDTTTAAGRRAARALIEVAGWQRALTANGASRRQPHPQLRSCINAMRAHGMSLQAICDTLNAEGVPAPRPGTRWRPSTVDLFATPPGGPSGADHASLARPHAM